ncbi:MAG: hypothetical protein K1X92_12645 [Bacteroidia bacterium]|nr:hypothetical protein [Bacteroidia bacterium]
MTIGEYTEILNNPQDYGLDMKPFKAYFQKSDEVTAQHELAEQFRNDINSNVPRLVIYILLQEHFGNAKHCDIIIKI